MNKKKKTIHLSDLNPYLRYLEEQGAESLIIKLEKEKEEILNKTKLSIGEWVSIIINQIKENRIKDAVILCQWYIKIGYENKSAIELLLAQLYDRTGEHKHAAKILIKLLEDEQVSSDVLIGAANLFIRYGDDKKGLCVTVAKNAFEKSGKNKKYLSQLIYIAQVSLDWDFLDYLIIEAKKSYEEDDYDGVAESPRTHVLWCNNEKTNIEVLKSWSKRTIKKVLNETKQVIEPFQNRKIKVGYLSSDFREHPTSRLISGLIKNHDKAKFELHMYCSGWDDGSKLRKELESNFDRCFSLKELSDKDASELIRSNQVDILVELNGPTRANRLGILAYRPAPVQIDYLGWPGSIGGNGLADFIIADEYVITQENKKFYPEKIIQLSSTYQVNDHKNYPQIKRISKQAMGISENDDVIVMGMFNAINKVTRDVWDVWMQIMNQCLNTQLLILDPGQYVRKKILEYAELKKIDVNRIKFSPRVDEKKHLQRLTVCDLILDPWPYGGHTSATDALYAGVPVLAMLGTNFVSRVNGSLLKAAKLGSLIAKNEEDYVNKAVELIRNKSKLEAYKKYLSENIRHLPILDSAHKAREIEAAYQFALKRAIDGLPQRNIRFKRKL